MPLDTEIYALLVANWHNDNPVVGTADLSGGHDCSVNNHTFKIAYDGGVDQVITLDAEYTPGSVLVATLQSSINAAIGAGKVTVSLTSAKYITFTILLYHYIILTANTTDFLVVMGITAGTYHSEIPIPKKILLNQPEAEPLSIREMDILTSTGRLLPNASDGSDDLRDQDFSLIGQEGNRTDAGEIIAAFKRILKRASSTTNGTYRITDYDILRGPQVGKYIIHGNNQKILADDEF